MKKKAFYQHNYFVLLLMSVGLMSSCRHSLLPDKRFYFPNKAQQQNAILDDANFFEQIGNLDMCIQLHEPDTQINRQDLLARYKQLLSASVNDTFSHDNKKRLHALMTGVFDDVKQYFPNLALDKPIGLLNCNGNHYGKTAFYTRAYNIVMPPYYKEMSYDELQKVLYHEWFHVWSRNTSSSLREMYELLQVTEINPDSMHLYKSAFLKQRTLLNPDGMRAVFYTDEVSHKRYLPVLYSKYAALKPELSQFFDYTHFQLFELEQLKNSETPRVLVLEVVSQNIGQDAELFPQFFDVSHYNTNYNIHPDEILADNFALLISTKKNPTLLSTLSPEGQAFLNALEQCLLRMPR